MRNTDFNPIDTAPNRYFLLWVLIVQDTVQDFNAKVHVIISHPNLSHQNQNVKCRWEGLIQTSWLAYDLAYLCKHDRSSKKRCFESNPRFSQSMAMTPLFISPTFTSLFSLLHFPKCLSVTPPLHPRKAAAVCFALSCAFWSVGASSEDQANVKRKSCSPDSLT